MKNAKDFSTSSAKIVLTLFVGGIIWLAILKLTPEQKPPPLTKMPDLAEHESVGLAIPEKASPKETALHPAQNQKITIPTESGKDFIRADFERLTQDVQARLPVMSDFKRLRPHEVHNVPVLIQKAGVDLGRIAQALHDNPHLTSSALEFYARCFQRFELPVQIRGLCLANHRRLRMDHSDTLQWTAEELEYSSPEIRALAEKIPL